MPGPHGFAVRFSAVRPARRECTHETSLNREPALRFHFAPDAAASTAFRHHVRDDRDTPLLSGRNDTNDMADFSKRPSGIFFEAGVDRFSREASDLPVRQSFRSISCPGRVAACNAATQIRDPRGCCKMGPGLAAHHAAKCGALRSIRGTRSRNEFSSVSRTRCSVQRCSAEPGPTDWQFAPALPDYGPHRIRAR